MTPLAQSNLEHGQDFVVSELDPNMSLDPKFLAPIEDTVGSDPTQ